jgi:polygalacturonase
MKALKLFILVFLIGITTTANANEYKASFFGIKSDGVTNNTASIQKAINYIHNHGGGTLIFYVGRYLTGTVYLKTNVHIKLKEGAIIIGSSSPYYYNYEESGSPKAIIVAKGQSNIGISGKGVVEGDGFDLIKNTRKLLDAGYLKKDIEPSLVAFSNCVNVSIKTVNLWYGAYNALTFKNCKIVKVKNIHINGKAIPSSAGIFLRNDKWVKVDSLFVKVKQWPIMSADNQHVKIQNSITSTGMQLSKYLK